MEGGWIRRATREDVYDLGELIAQLAELEPDFELNRRRARTGLETLIDTPGTAVFVAETDGAISGMCTVQSIVSTAEGGPVGVVEDLVVSKTMRREGIGSALITAAENWSRAHGLTRLQLLADRGNIAALKFYERTGWDSTRMICLRKKPL